MATNPKAKPVPTRAGSMAEFVDHLLMQGTTWANLEKRCKAEAAKRGTATLSSIGTIRAHVRYRASQAKWDVKQDDTGVRMNIVTTPAKAEKAKAAPKAKPAAKNGKPVGRKTRAVKQNGRQAVEPVADQPASTPEPEQSA